MAREAPRVGVGPAVARVAPMLDIIRNGSTDVNVGRSAQSGSVATRRARATPLPVRLLTRDEIGAIVRARTGDEKPPDVDVSLFVELSEDLDPDARRAARTRIGAIARSARWKLNTGAIEVRGTRLEELEGVRGISYIEPGQTLRTPEPAVGRTVPAPDPALRRVAAQARRHGYGRDVLVGIIDVGGFDFAHPDFLADGGTRWVAIWDQGGTSRPAPAARDRTRYASLDYGSEIRKEHMDRAIAAAPERGMAAASLEPQSTMVVGSHGTHVASIAAGNRGVARRAHLAGVLVALRPEDMLASSSFYDSTRIAHAVDYLMALAAELGGDAGPLPVSMNISLGTNGHAHDTSSAMARWIDNALATPGRCVTVAAGNAGQVEPAAPDDRRPLTGRIHAGGSIAATGLRQDLGWVVAGGQVADISENEMEIWYGAQDRISVEIRPPDGDWIGPIGPGEHMRNDVLPNGTVLSVHNETYHPANGANRISIVLSPFFGPVRRGERQIGPIAGGEWQVRLTGTVIRDGRYDAWIERDDARRVDARSWRYPSFFAPGSYTDDRMISSLACAERILAVANVDIGRNMAHVTSSRGPTREGRFKPDVGADGTDIVAARALDRARPWVEMTGTSMAAPYVCGVAALMLAIAPDLTSAQIQGIVRSTSRPLAGHDFTWRNDTGFGVIDAAACVAEAAR
ncbi:MAG TPA: S8 family serine peptidase [Solirubrobacteraceae bacterium]|nr:S8 family serine peptidase [Solirubrobacteraceae bacterium]